MQARGLERVGGGEQHTDARACEQARAGDPPERPPGERCQYRRRDAKADGEEREQRIDGHGVLHLDERHAPDRRHDDEQEQRCRPSHRRRLLGREAGDSRGNPATLWAMTALDTLGRPLRDLRISVTDRCNFRCVYCMPKEVFGRGYRFMDRKELLSFEELERLARAFVELGVEKIRITGGEPLATADLERLIERLATIDGLDLTLTTNGTLLPQKAAALAAAGLSRVTVSLDSLDDETFRAMNDVDFPTERVLDGIAAASAAGLPVKVNAVVKRGLNDQEIVPLARHFRGTGHTLRFIEYMDVGATNGWRLDDVVPAARDPGRRRRRVPARAGRRRLPWRGRAPLQVPGRGGRDRDHRLGHPAVLRRLHARPDLCRGPALHVSVRRQGPRPARARPLRRERRARSARPIGAVWTRRGDRYSEIRSERTIDAAQGRNELHRRLIRPPLRFGSRRADDG